RSCHIMIKFGSRTERTVGLDIGSSAIKVVAIDKTSGKKTLAAYNIKQIPADVKSFDRSSLIREALDEVDLHPEVVNLSLSGPEVIVRFINLPKMSKEQLEGALSFEAEKYIPFNVSDVTLDSIILGDAPDTGQMRVLLAAVKREAVGSLVKTVEGLDMAVGVVDIDPFAMFNAFTENNLLPEDEGNIFLNIGHSRTDMLIAIGKLPYFTREVQLGGRNIATDEERIAQDSVPVISNLIREMQLSLSYFENRYNKGISGIYCSGGVAYRERMIGYLGEKLGVTVKKWDPMAGLEISESISKEAAEEVALQLVVGIGLALR
ncbi:MAG: pilus assembly protein PilM, partial [Candidatus Omnitrophota bacterium]